MILNVSSLFSSTSSPRLRKKELTPAGAPLPSASAKVTSANPTVIKPAPIQSTSRFSNGISLSSGTKIQAPITISTANPAEVQKIALQVAYSVKLSSID